MRNSAVVPFHQGQQKRALVLTDAHRHPNPILNAQIDERAIPFGESKLLQRCAEAQQALDEAIDDRARDLARDWHALVIQHCRLREYVAYIVGLAAARGLLPGLAGGSNERIGPRRVRPRRTDAQQAASLLFKNLAAPGLEAFIDDHPGELDRLADAEGQQAALARINAVLARLATALPPELQHLIGEHGDLHNAECDWIKTRERAAYRVGVQVGHGLAGGAQ